MENKGAPLSLGTENKGKLLSQYAIPAIIAMTASSLCNITDSIFINYEGRLFNNEMDEPIVAKEKSKFLSLITNH